MKPEKDPVLVLKRLKKRLKKYEQALQEIALDCEHAQFEEECTCASVFAEIAQDALRKTRK